MSPADLQDVYGLAAASASNGANQTIAIVDAYDDPNAEADMGVYRANFGLSACTTANGCFMKVNQLGVAGNYPSTSPLSDDWALEISLDLDMASAICPNCEIVLVEAIDNSGGNLYTAENTAAGTCAATVISNSWGGGEYPGEDVDDTNFFQHPGVMITFASGDGGTGASFPPTSQYVTSVGGTTVKGSLGSWTESVWAGSGSGCSAFITQPSWQTSLGLSGCTMRMSNDVAAAADPNFGGAAIYDTFRHSGWLQVGGTSEATPIIAGVYAIAQNGGGITYGSYSYGHTGSLHDITSGTNGSCSPSYLCTAGSGWDGPSGNGTPNGVGGF